MPLHMFMARCCCACAPCPYGPVLTLVLASAVKFAVYESLRAVHVKLCGEQVSAED